MSKAEDRFFDYFLDSRLRNCSHKDAFLYGYQQAEKDLALTYEDVKDIVVLFNVVVTEKTYSWDDYCEACKETLKRYNKLKEK